MVVLAQIMPVSKDNFARGEVADRVVRSMPVDDEDVGESVSRDRDRHLRDVRQTDLHVHGQGAGEVHVVFVQSDGDGGGDEDVAVRAASAF
jgi:hypothetical protein